MRDVVKTMLRLQELELIKDENKILHLEKDPEHQAQLGQLEATIQQLTEQLPEKWRARYKALRRNGVAVVREFGGVCQQCRMVISVGVLNRMRKGENSWICPNCGRFLLLSEDNSEHTETP